MDFQKFLAEEKQRILAWFEEQEDDIEEVIKIITFRWKDHIIEWKGDYKYEINGSHMASSLEEALDYTEELIIKEYNS